MKLGLFLMPSHPPERDFNAGNDWDLEMLRTADRLGYSEAWIGEHFTSPWEPNPAPDLLIAQALLTNPKLLLLDEPLASLDLKSQHEIVHLVEAIRTERQMAVILVAHDLNPLLEMLDGIVFILNGKVVAGTLDEVVRSDLLSQLYETAVHVHVTSDGHRFVVGA